MAPFVFQVWVQVEVMLYTIVVDVVEPFTLLVGIFVRMAWMIAIDFSVPLIKRDVFYCFIIGMPLVVGYTLYDNPVRVINYFFN